MLLSQVDMITLINPHDPIGLKIPTPTPPLTHTVGHGYDSSLAVSSFISLYGQTALALFSHDM